MKPKAQTICITVDLLGPVFTTDLYIPDYTLHALHIKQLTLRADRFKNPLEQWFPKLCYDSSNASLETRDTPLRNLTGTNMNKCVVL